MMNRLANVKNPYQGNAKKVLCVCSAGLLRSPTVAEILSREPFNFNTRAAGISKEYALIAVDEALCEWADEIVCMEESHKKELPTDKPIHVLGLQDCYEFRDPELVEIASAKLLDIFARY